MQALFRNLGIDEVTAWCHERDLEVLVEVHSHYLRQVEIARQVDYVQDIIAHDADDPRWAGIDHRHRVAEVSVPVSSIAGDEEGEQGGSHLLRPCRNPGP